MKNYNNKIWLFLLVFIPLFWSCGPEEIIKYSEGDFVSFQEQQSSIGEGGDVITLEIARSTTDLSGSLTVSLQVTAEYASTTSFFDAGDDASSTFVISASEVSFGDGEAIKEIELTSINDITASGDKTVTVTITGVSDNRYNIGTPGPDALYSQQVITLVDDDCPLPDLVGDFSVTTTDTSPAGCEGVTNTVSISFVSDNGDGTSTYHLSDVTGGLYLNCYGAADNPGDIVIDGLSVSLIAQPDVVYGGDQFDGTGSINSCEGTMTLSWSNGYGDHGTTLFTL